MDTDAEFVNDRWHDFGKRVRDSQVITNKMKQQIIEEGAELDQLRSKLAGVEKLLAALQRVAPQQAANISLGTSQPLGIPRAVPVVATLGSVRGVGVQKEEVGAVIADLVELFPQVFLRLRGLLVGTPDLEAPVHAEAFMDPSLIE